MSKTSSKQMLPTYLPAGWEGLKPALEKAADNHSNPALQNVSALVRHILAKSIGFKPLTKYKGYK